MEVIKFSKVANYPIHFFSTHRTMFIFYNPRRRRLSLLPAGPLSSHSPSTIYTFYSHPLFSASRTLHTRSCLRPHILTTRLDAPSPPSYHPRPHFSTHLGLPIFFVYSPSLITVRKYYLRPPPYLSRRFLPRLYSRPPYPFVVSCASPGILISKSSGQALFHSIIIYV